MHARTSRDLGAIIRAERRRAGLTQADLATAAGVTRAWVIAVEGGKSSVELGLVLRTLDALGLVADVVAAPPAGGTVDLDDLLA